MDNFISIDYLGTLSGCVTITCLLTQFTKEIIDIIFPKVRTKYICFIFSLVSIVIFQVSKGTLFQTNFYVIIINAIIVALTSLGAYDVVIKGFDEKKIK